MLDLSITNYLKIVNYVFLGIFTFLSLLVLHFIIVGIFGLFGNKKYPTSTKKGRYGCIIPARNEENTVADLIKSIRKSDYPQDKLDIFVVAHNCTDKTAEVARAAGAIVYEYNNPNECTMGFAFKALFKFIEKNYNTQSYDGFFLFNADNIVAENYFTKMLLISTMENILLHHLEILVILIQMLWLAYMVYILQLALVLNH